MTAVPPRASVSSILRVDLVVAEHIALATARLLVEGAEPAARDAVVGVVDVAVDDEGDLVAGVGRRRTASARAPSSSRSPPCSERPAGLVVAEARRRGGPAGEKAGSSGVAGAASRRPAVDAAGLGRRARRAAKRTRCIAGRRVLAAVR